MVIISAVVCTYKRADYLRSALRSLCDQTLPREQYEVIVVDNAVEVETKRVVDEFSGGEINLSYTAEPQIGLSHARNRALKEARGKYVAFLDDDARADTSWLKALLNAFEGTGAAAVGGRVWLDWEGEKPVWVHDEQLSLFTFVDHGDEAHALRDGEYLVGANVAFRRDAANEIGGFDANLGRQGSVLLSGEEAKLISEITKRGETVYYEPDALVWHSVHPSRKRPSWLLRRMFWDGASQPLISHEQPSRGALIRAVVFDSRQCLRWAVSALTARIRGRKSNAWESLLGFSQRAGRVRTQMQLFFNARKTELREIR